MSVNEAVVEVRRGEVVESRHLVSAALLNDRGELLAHLGQPERVAYWRSAAKPFQALPIVSEGVVHDYDFTARELAVCCASHSGEVAHVETVLGLLSRIGCEEDDLVCGPHWPFHKPSGEALRSDGREPTRVHNNCSGKHTGMLALARALDADTEGYRRADHPVQMRIKREIAEWTGVSGGRMKTAVDGCGVLTFALPLTAMAQAYARLVTAADKDAHSAAGHVVRAMTEEPYYVAGTGRLETDLMTATDGRMLAKIGAEGIFCLAERQRGWGAALKVEDGNKRAIGSAVIDFLIQVDLLTEAEKRELEEHRIPVVENTLDEAVGEIHPAFRVQRDV